MLADHELGGDRAVAPAGGDETEHLELAGREPVRAARVGCREMGLDPLQIRRRAELGERRSRRRELERRRVVVPEGGAGEPDGDAGARLLVRRLERAPLLRRAREWTRALADWWALQPEMVAFTGRCLVHRAEIMQLDGAWPDALEEARRAGERFVETGNPAAGLARYRLAELLRLQGDFPGAESAYREASGFGWEPQPGLAQLRLAQGRTDAAVSAIARAEAAAARPLDRARLLPAFVEIMLAAGDLESARRACNELEAIAAGFESAMLGAVVAHARGSVHLAAGEPREALVPLRTAVETWHRLGAPYEIARTRALVGDACRMLGDTESAALEHDAARAILERLGARPDLARLESRASGSRGLSAREVEVLRLVAAGRTNRQIAASLVISEHTVARHLQNIFAKLGVSSRAAATAFAFEHDLV